MTNPELEQLDLLARIDELVDRLRQWAEPGTAWGPMNRCRALVKRLLSRVETLRIRLEAPLIVATFGGTGTGKSTLVNALVGKDATKTGRQRPTTTRPVLLAHPDAHLEAFGLPLEDFEIVRVDSSTLRDIVIIDCPDPDTTENETAGSNLERLHRLLPFCDVLIYTSTQQKYRSARVLEELGQAATGCRLLFVQTHADVDSDIRDDWRKNLEPHFDVPEMFFVDSNRAFADQQENRRPGGDFGRLIDTLTSQLAASQRVLVRRANLIDLVHAALEHCRKQLAGHSTEIEQLQAALEEQRQKLTGKMSQQLRTDLLASRNLWERRLLTSVTQKWGFSPFSAVLRLYNGIGGLIASMTLYRARTAAQMALIGAVQGARWVGKKAKQILTEDRVEEQLSTLTLDESALRESQFVLTGYVKSARLDPGLIDGDSGTDLRDEAVRVEEEFVTDAGQKVDRVIEDLATKNTGFLTRIRYEVLFLAYVVFILFRVGKNFFYDSFLIKFFEDNVQTKEMLGSDFWITSGVFFVLWSLILVMLFTGRLRRGLNGRIHALADELTEVRVSRGLFPRLSEACRQIELQRNRLDVLSDNVAELRSGMASTTGLGAQREPRSTDAPAEASVV